MDVMWIVYDSSRAGPAREFQDRESALEYRNRRTRETGGRWVVRFRGTGPAIAAVES
jgi:hypothetical protein